MTPGTEGEEIGFLTHDAAGFRTRYVIVRGDDGRCWRSFRMICWTKYRPSPARGIGQAGCLKSSCPERKPRARW